MTYCNPPPPPQDPPVIPIVADAGTAITPPPSAADAGAPIATGCPTTIVADKRCSTDGMKCREKSGCGSNGWQCEKGKWREMFTYCNPPPPPPTR